jgi:hypothetical protein
MNVKTEPIYVAIHVGECVHCGHVVRATVESRSRKLAREHRLACPGTFRWSMDLGQPVGYQLALTICDA